MSTILRYVAGKWVDGFTEQVTLGGGTTTVINADFGLTQNQLTVTLDARASTANSGKTITSYRWDFGDDSPYGSGATTTHAYASPSTYAITLTVTDSGGAVDTMTRAVTVKSTALDYIADSQPYFNVLLHPAGAAVAQCIVQSPDTGQWYMSQVHPETTAQFGNAESMRISRMGADGTLIDQMLCNYGGHGTSIGLEVSAGQMYIWTTYFQPAVGSSTTHDIVRFPYKPGTFDRSQITGLQVKIPGGIYRRFQFDWKNQYVLLTEDPTWKRYNLTDFLNGNLATPVNSLTIPVNPPTMQGLCTYGDSAFFYSGDGADDPVANQTVSGGPITMYEYSWKTAQRVAKIDLSQMLVDDTTGSYVDGHLEPESCTIYDTGANNPVLNFGLITGPPGGVHNYYVYSFDLIAQADALAGRPFELRETKPTTSNVGAGILRPVTAVHNGDLTITTNNFILQDTIVNGAVTVAAANVTIENCIIKGPAADPGATTVNPVFLVNTDNAAAANGPALIRYSTITGLWKSPNVYGVGSQNYVLEFSDISRVVEGARAGAAAAGGDASAIIRGNYIHDLIFYCPDPTNPTNVTGTNAAGQALSGTWAGRNWNWASGVHVLSGASTGIAVYGNNIVATWANDPAVSTTPLPPAYARLNAVRLTDAKDIAVEDNWLDGGEQCFYAPGTATTGNVARNRFGRQMATTSTADSGYFALVISSPTLVSNDADSLDRNVWADTGSAVQRRGSTQTNPDPAAARKALVAGTYVPDATTTGLYPSTTKASLRVVTGNASGVLQLLAGDVYTNCWIKARVIKPTSGTATLTNCWIDGGTYNFSAAPVTGLVDCTGNNGGLLVMEDCQIEAVSPGLYGNGVIGFNYSIRRCRIRSVVDGCVVTNTTSPAGATNVLIEACYINDLAYFSPDPTQADGHSHNDCVQITGGSGTKIHGNNLQATYITTVGQGTATTAASGSAVSYLPTQSVAITTTEVWQNNLDGGTQSVTAVVGNGPTGGDIGYIHDNTFGHNQASLTVAGDSTARKRPILIDAALSATGIAPISGSSSKVDTNGNVYNDTKAAITDYVTGSAPTPVLVSRVVGIPTATTARFAVRTSNATSVRIKVGTDSAVTQNVVFGAAATPNAQGDAVLGVSGLTTSTRQMFYRVAMTDANGAEVLDSSTVGKFRTAPTAAASFAFNFGSCTNASDSASMAAMANRNDDLFFHLGDLYYADGSGTGISNIRSKFSAKMQVANHAALFSTTASAYTPSDHDGMNNNSTAGDDATAWTNWNAVYREMWAAPTTIPSSKGVYHTFVWGRVRFIVLDDRSFKTISSATDNSSKTALGATQKQWLKDLITNSTEPAFVIIQGAPWQGTSAGDDGWAGYATERNELADFFSASGKKIIMLGGDMHAVAASNSSLAPGGVTLFQAAPFNNSSSIKYAPYSVGPYPASGSSTVQQYGRVAVTDTGSQITFAFTGYSSDNTARVTLSTSVTG